MDTPDKPKLKRAIDWEAIEGHYRAGIRSVRDIAGEYGITHGAINKRAARDGWERDLAAKIKANVVLGIDEFDRAGFVYVIYLDDSADERFYKIGMASHFTSRFQNHRCSSPFNICVACAYYVGNMRQEEKYLHTVFAEQRVRGEWFRLNEDDLSEIASRALLV